VKSGSAGSLVPFVALRWFSARRRAQGLGISALSVLGIAVGVATLMTVLAVMNGFQMGFMESIVEIDSYHLRLVPIGPAPGGALSREELDSLAQGISATAAVAFTERQALAGGPYSRGLACRVRAAPEDLLSKDPALRARLAMQDGPFDLGKEGGAVIGAELAVQLGVRRGDSIEITSMGFPQGAAPRPVSSSLTVAGIFRSGYLEFDQTLLFVSFPTARAAFGETGSVSYGLKLRDRFRDREALAAAEAWARPRGFRAVSWREYNRAFFDTLLMEKIVMMILVGLIFVVVGFNIAHALRRSVFERREDLAVLAAIGVPPARIRGIFVLDGFLIGGMGGTIGTAVGLLLASQVNAVFASIERIVNGLFAVVYAVAALSARDGREPFTLFSSTYFYMTEIPSRIVYSEVLIVALFALLSATLAAVAASRKVSEIRPAEVLRYE
jgi:lipoprotein-releasing system permease protein